MDIVWDADKAAANLLKHQGVSFEEATAVLFDPLALTREDSDAEGEQRFLTLGRGGKGRVLVVHTWRGETIRIISAWKANPVQRRRYESQY